MSVPSVFRSARNMAENHGRRAALYDLTMRAVNRCMYYKELHCFMVEKVHPQSLELPDGFRFTRVDDNLVFELTKDPKHELNLRFARYALRKGDECFGIFDGDSLANYGWYSRKPTLMDNEDLYFHFDPRFVYMYKGYTLDKYRGLRLHAISKTRSLAEFISRGAKGMISYIESNNFNSIKSTYRMGARACGRIRVMRLAGRYIVRTDQQCRQHGLTMKPRSASEEMDSFSFAVR